MEFEIDRRNPYRPERRQSARGGRRMIAFSRPDPFHCPACHSVVGRPLPPTAVQLSIRCLQCGRQWALPLEPDNPPFEMYISGRS
jgi:hypothetical protein